jgi:hypothetical protein
MPRGPIGGTRLLVQDVAARRSLPAASQPTHSADAPAKNRHPNRTGPPASTSHAIQGITAARGRPSLPCAMDIGTERETPHHDNHEASMVVGCFVTRLIAGKPDEKSPRRRPDSRPPMRLGGLRGQMKGGPWLLLGNSRGAELSADRTSPFRSQGQPIACCATNAPGRPAGGRDSQGYYGPAGRISFAAADNRSAAGNAAAAWG